MVKTKNDSKLLERVAKLREEIRLHEHRYYVLDRPSVRRIAYRGVYSTAPSFRSNAAVL